MNVWQSLALLWLLAAAVQTVGWLHQRRTRNAGIVDVLWASGVGGGAVLIALCGHGAVSARVTLALLGGAWGARLAWHLWRRVYGESEDGRYAHLRTLWGNSDSKWFLFFQFQALLVVVFALPFVPAANLAQAPATGMLILALAIWLLAVGGEAQADRQLAAFRRDPANHGRVCQVGWWRYSRHPNYFFEWLHWFAYVALASGAWLSWLGPIVMFTFLRWLSGIPHTEAQSLRSRGEAYREYQRSTSMLIPWFPRSKP